MKYFYLFVLSGFCACSVFHPERHETPLTNRYKTIDPSVEKSDANSVVDVSTLTIPAEVLDTSKDGGKTIFDLKSYGQKALIDEFARKDDDGQKRLNALMNATYQSKKSSDGAVIVKKDYTIVFSTVLKDFYSLISQSLSAGDRIAKLRITVSISASDRDSVKFLKWDKFSTQFAQFNIGGTSFNVARQATLSPSIPIGAGSLTAGTLGKTSTYQENDSLQLRFVLLNGTLTKDSIILDQTGTPQVDLQGNTTIAITVAFPFVEGPPFFSFEVFQNGDGAFQTAEKVSVTKSGNPYPQLGHDVNLNMRVDYVLRHIKEGERSFTEGDDEISYYWGHFTRNIPQFIKFADLRPKSWNVTNNKKALGLYDDVTKKYYELAFGSFSDATDFLEWVANKVPAYPNKIKIGKFYLTSDIDVTTHPYTPTWLIKNNLGSLDVGLNP
jgi:hypothetical protein